MLFPSILNNFLLPLNQVALLARIVPSFISDSLSVQKYLKECQTLIHGLFTFFSCSSYAYNFLLSGETSYSVSSTIWMEISYLLSYDISYLIPLVHKLKEKGSWFCRAGSVHSQCAQFAPYLFLLAVFLSVDGC